MVFQKYVSEIQNEIERRQRLTEKRKIKTDVFLQSIKITIEEIRNRRAKIYSISSENNTEQLDALWKYIKDIDCILDGIEQSCLDTISLREAL